MERRTMPTSQAALQIDTTNNKPQSYPFGQTLDFLERRQEAAVLSQLRRLSETHPSWAENPSLVADLQPAWGMEPRSEFRDLSMAQIAEVMAGEQKLLESRIQRRVSESCNLELDDR
ncbi:hypothetical protein METBIDRAFT_10745 [Metschnikowia bicuspidata var. bicuspidata NRRL YB-4993]|uniref:Uncharacterized protein n=1 Tax=Metschnikowia bicuspidata var. bicuspidata NRRL YB-4993 TaxID=869754 RepID=A0A1A0HCH8_9ASCO|nr:hypothetical protein METBIDRAFT_10745 [Metschnikowia bicuspidata var. bicuspidata NRRL YB-4993]OBA21819.1 hypothetical protein METBIDRAFT_10745 [Metschnikowia bicuspidata var. bicuspidata NRRL YB-4993]